MTELVLRVCGVFVDDPGTRLSVSQAGRLTGIALKLCPRILEALTVAEFLKLGEDETFTRR